MSKVLVISLFFYVFTLINQLNADGSVCEERAILDIAKDAIIKAKDLYPNCDEDENDPISCGRKEKSLAYLEVAKTLISTAKENYPTCNLKSNSHSRVTMKNLKPIDCSEVLENGHNDSGVYSIWPKNRIFFDRPLKVYCDMDTDNGGWTVIQRRGNFTEQENFYRDWADYKAGFGDVKKDFWLGNDNIYALTNQDSYIVRFDLQDVKGEKRYAVYREFWIHEEAQNYLLHITNYSGNAGDSMDYHNAFVFQTMDRPDEDRDGNCAEMRKSGWWFDFCTESNLNGVNQPGEVGKTGITWYSFKSEESLASTEIKVKRLSFV